MKILNAVISNDAPNKKDVVWIRPVEGGFTLYTAFDGKWQALKVMEDNDTASIADDVEVKLKDKADKVSNATNGNFAALNSKGNLTDSGKKATDFEIAGAANAAKNAVIGTAEDDKDTMTLYGLKAYIDDALAS